MPWKLAHPLAAALLSLVALSVVGCKKGEQRFESVCQVVRRDEVEVDDKGETQVVDVELEWDPCPGDQYQVVRGGKEFAACMKQYDVGKLVPVFAKHWWDDRGYYTWDVYQVGNCKRDIESNSEGSYEKSQECNDSTMYGLTTGFSCSRRPFKGLVQACPWMIRQ